MNCFGGESGVLTWEGNSITYALGRSAGGCIRGYVAFISGLLTDANRPGDTEFDFLIRRAWNLCRSRETDTGPGGKDCVTSPTGIPIGRAQQTT